MTTDEGLLDMPVWASLTGAHAHLAERNNGAVRYPPDVAPFAALADAADPENWLDLAQLFGPGAVAVLPGVTEAPDGWEIVDVVHAVQLVDASLRAETDNEAVPLDHADVPEILELIARTRPGPFLPRTIELGDYSGIRRVGALIAMAGERMHPAGWTEISAVCTDAAYRGQGLGTRLIRHVAAGIRGRGESAFLHAAATNVNAIRLYESIGFTHRRDIRFLIVRTPPSSAGLPT
ncbi:MAG TPA: GNAT family N-acetyltransferase [Acidothermaceae bacterium]|jgi:ribosomal protein S18 acetylase RimI-like enzyme